MAASRWISPEVYPLFASMGVAVGICSFSLVRNLLINPEVRVNKEGRAAGVLENFDEGEKYKEHALRKFVRNHAVPQQLLRRPTEELTGAESLPRLGRHNINFMS